MSQRQFSADQLLTLLAGAASMALAVALGAFGAHGLASHLEPKQLEVYKTGVQYQFYHGLGILFTVLLHRGDGRLPWRWPSRCFVLGIILFSGSLYLLSTTTITGLSLRWLGPVTPLGGLAFLLGWSLLLVGVVRVYRGG